jgi:hypothetical protein
MIKFTPRFFVLPLIALAVIASLPRPSAQACPAGAAPAAGIVAPSTGSDCPPVRQRLVMAPT